MPATVRLTLDLAGRPRIYPARLHGAACALLETTRDDHRRQHKPFAVGPLYDVGGHTRWRLGWLTDHDPPPLPRLVRFGDTPCPVLDVRVEQTSYAELARSEPARHAQLRMTSPLYFSRSGRDHPLPDPVLIVRSAAQRWNAHAPEMFTIADKQIRAVTGTVFLHDMEGETVRTPVSATMHQTGFLGSVRLGLTKSADHAARMVFAALLRFAALAGVGAQTTHGFGSIQLEELSA
ncbi:CRISPR system precrRNA processing endoribonuclease RAMP protein Cas6 [Saccharomonospora azurea]